jgi:2-polyprenyl-3-methyl-5-hydroxy-6-metoxy-1,4-benzoquinol methylase
VNGFYRSLLDLVARSGCKQIHEVGCGEGHLTVLLAKAGYQVHGSDFSEKALNEARALCEKENVRVPLTRFDFLKGAIEEEQCSDLIVCCEVLEHLENPQQALQRLARLTKNKIILSVPCEPVWSFLNLCRGRYLRSMGNTPGHVQRFSKQGFLKEISHYFDIEAVRTPLPWTMVLAKPK